MVKERMAQAFIAGLVFPNVWMWNSDLFSGCSRGCKYHPCYLEDLAAQLESLCYCEIEDVDCECGG